MASGVTFYTVSPCSGQRLAPLGQLASLTRMGLASQPCRSRAAAAVELNRWAAQDTRTLIDGKGLLMKTSSSSGVNGLTRTLVAINKYMSEDFLGGPKVLRWAWVINFQKLLTPVYIALLMYWFSNYATVAWVYLALHGTYSLCWLLKHVAFPDASWEKKVTFGGAAMILAILLLYWAFPYLLISGVLGPDHAAPSNALLTFCISLHTFGVVIMIASDAQKHFTLKYRPGLINEGMFKYTRNPNYLGEMMLYAAYALLVQHWIAWTILIGVWLVIFLPNMLSKDLSLSRHQGWEAYRARSGMILPWPFTSAILRNTKPDDAA